MTVKRVFFVISFAWTLVNVAGVGFAVAEGELPHALTHAALTVIFGAVTWRLRHRTPPVASVTEPAHAAEVVALQAEVASLQRQLQEQQEGLDFAEQLLARRTLPQSNIARRELQDLAGEP